MIPENSIEFTKKYHSLETIDKKDYLLFFNNELEEPSELDFKMKKFCKTKNDKLWIIDNFLSEDECKKIIKTCDEQKFHKLDQIYDKTFRNSERIIAFETNQILCKNIERRLKHDETFIKRLSESSYKPYGFGIGNTEWEDYNGEINKCLRFNKYTNSNGFDWHRDSQYCESFTKRSTHTILIYLNEDYKNGETSFLLPDKEVVHCGQTMDEELKIYGDNIHKISVKPKIGRAIIFDQRYIHKGEPIEGIKYIMRTDLLRQGNSGEIEQHNEKMMYKLTCGIFRQAELYELMCQEDIKYKNLSKELYERSISLRLNPRELSPMYDKLQEMIKDIKTPVTITENVKFVSRSGNKYNFNYKLKYLTLNDYNLLLRIATIFTLTSHITFILSDEPADEPEDESEKSEDEPVDGLTDEPVDGLTDEPVDEQVIKLSDKPIDGSNYQKIKTYLFTKSKLLYDVNIKLENYEEEETIKFDYDPEHKNYITTDKYGDKIVDEEMDDDINKIIKDEYPNFLDKKSKNSELSVLIKSEWHKFRRKCYMHGCDMGKTILLSQLYAELEVPSFTIDITYDKMNENKYEGKMLINGMKKTINHASCNTDEINIYDSYKISENIERSLTFELGFEIDIVNNTIMILIDPEISL